ncbi:hypothetical protein [Kribbella sp. NPDC004536]|uniref:hypothetical protein n=1 Tax=Kribbella sp. NPDC004536 TaxID=3364106 RepID=UPI003676C66D
MIKPLGAIAAAALVTATLVPGTATASTAASCGIAVGSVTAAGDHLELDLRSTRPPTADAPYSIGQHVYPPGAVRVSASQSLANDGISIFFVGGYSILGDALYYANYAAPGGGPIDGSVQRVGGGWGTFVALEQTGYADTVQRRNNGYGLRNDGTLFRWSIDNKGVWRSPASAPGFAAVKSMTLLRATKTYDLFLANTRGGGLYTILLPATVPLKPVVKLVRAATWQGFETLIAQPCGRYGFVLLGIDKDTQTGYLYAVGAPNGTSTVIQGLGKPPVKFSDPVYFHWAFAGN